MSFSISLRASITNSEIQLNENENKHTTKFDNAPHIETSIKVDVAVSGQNQEVRSTHSYLLENTSSRGIKNAADGIKVPDQPDVSFKSRVLRSTAGRYLLLNRVNMAVVGLSSVVALTVLKVSTHIIFQPVKKSTDFVLSSAFNVKDERSQAKIKNFLPISATAKVVINAVTTLNKFFVNSEDARHDHVGSICKDVLGYMTGKNKAEDILFPNKT